MTNPLPPLTPGFGQQIVGPDGSPVYSAQPAGVTMSANEPLSPTMPSGMVPPSTPQGIIGTPGNTPMTDSSTAIKGMIEEQTQHMALVTQMMDQLQSTMEKSSKQMESDFTKMRHHTTEMAAITAETVEHMVKQVKTALAENQAAPGGKPAVATDRPVDEHHAATQAADDHADAQSAHPADSPEGQAQPAVHRGHRRHRTAPGAQPARQTAPGQEEPPPTPPAPHGSQPQQEEDDLPPAERIYRQHRKERPPQGQSFRELKSMSIPDMLRRASGRVAQKMSTVESRYQVTTDETGAQKVLRADTGEEVGATEVAKRNVASHVGSGLGRFAETGEAGGLLGIAEGPVGWAAAALGVAHEGLHQYQNQQQKNMFYQQITGGSNWGSGIAGRAREGAFAWSNMFTMPGSQARELYRGVASMAPGQTQESRDFSSDALNFAVHQYKKTGMDVADSLNLIRTNFEHGVTSFNQLNTAITAVSDTAKQAGENTQEAVKNFSQLYGSVLGNVTSSAPTAAAVSTGITNTITQAGKQLGLTAGNLTGALSGSGLYATSNQLGLTPNAAEATLAGGGPQGTKLAGQLEDTAYQQFWMDIGGPSIAQIAQSYAQQHGFKGAATGPQQTEVGEYLATNGYVNLDAAIQIAANPAVGLGNFTPAQMEQLIGQLMLTDGNVGIGKQIAKAQQEQGGQAASTPGKINGKSIITNADVTTTRNTSISDSSDYRAAEGSYGPTSPQATQMNQLYKQVGGENWESQKYIGMVESRGSRSPVLEALLKGKKDYEKDHFIVQTKDGQKEVSYKELFNTYKDQAETGNVEIAESGQTVTDATGAQGTGGDITATKSAKRNAPKGSEDVKASKGSGTVTIAPSSELQKWFTFITTGGVNVDQANRAGVPAAAFPSDPSQYSTATGGS